MKMSQQKQRSVNFSKCEEEKLVALVLEKKNVFENKRTDAVSTKQKDAAWEKLAEKFNASSESNRVSNWKQYSYPNIIFYFFFT